MRKLRLKEFKWLIKAALYMHKRDFISDSANCVASTAGPHPQAATIPLHSWAFYRPEMLGI